MDKEGQSFASKGKVGGSNWRIFTTSVLSVLLSFASIFTFGGFFSKYNWIFDMFSHFRFHYFIFCLSMFFLCLLFRRRILILLSIVLCVVNLVPIIPLYIPYGDFNKGDTQNSQEIKIVHFNVLTSNQDYQRTKEYIEEKNPDIISLNEVNQNWVDNMNLSQKYKYSVMEIREDNFGIALFSKIELINPRIEYFGDAKLPSAAAEINVRDKEVSVLATHPLPPVNRSGFEYRDNQLASIIQNRNSFKPSMILIGDLNTTSWSYGFQNLLKGMDLYGSRRGYGLGFSWPVTMPILLVPIDHCLVSKDIEVLKRETGPDLGSDHLPIYIELRIAKASSNSAPNNDNNTGGIDKDLEVLPKETAKEEIQKSIINPEGTTIQERFDVPDGFERIPVTEGSFAQYLRDMVLKPHGTAVHYFDGHRKFKDVHDAVIDMDVGERDLQQCADAVMRFRAEYLYHKGLYDKIHFNFTNGFKAEYTKWRNGYRIAVEGNNAYWVKRAGYSEEYSVFRQYMDMVFAYAGTVSLSQELDKVNVEDMEIGDVFMKGDLPGHCVIVMDMAENKSTGEKIFIVAQSYMPAQDIHVLKNLNDAKMSPWYSLNFGEVLKTPEWTFYKDQLMRFKE